MADPYIKRNNLFPTQDFRKASLKPRPPSWRADPRLKSPEQKLEWVKSLQGRVGAHMKRHEQMWVGRESVRLINNRFQPKLNHPPPRIPGLGTTVLNVPDVITRQARQNVRARMTTRLTGLANKRASLERQIKGPSQSQSQKQSHEQSLSQKQSTPKLKQTFKQKASL